MPDNPRYVKEGEPVEHVQPYSEIRWLVIVNWLLVPYVALRFPREVKRYLRRCWEVTRAA